MALSELNIYNLLELCVFCPLLTEFCSLEHRKWQPPKIKSPNKKRNVQNFFIETTNWLAYVFSEKMFGSFAPWRWSGLSRRDVCHFYGHSLIDDALGTLGCSGCWCYAWWHQRRDKFAVRSRWLLRCLEPCLQSILFYSILQWLFYSLDHDCCCTFEAYT